MRTKRFSQFTAALVLLLVGANAQAHALWVNSFESFAHPPGHAMVSLGFGHALPMDDFLATPDGQINLESFSFVDPNLKKTAMGAPRDLGEKPQALGNGLTLERGDLALYKVQLGEKTSPGVYQVEAKSKVGYFTKFIDDQGKERMKMAPMNEIGNAKQVLFGAKYQAFAKSFVIIGPWSEPKPLGHGLEIMPKSDLATIRAGELVDFYVTFEGKPVSSDGKGGMQYLTASSNTFGGPDGFSLASPLLEGKARFRVPTAGQWLVNVYVMQPVTKEGPLKDEFGKTQAVWYSGTLTFNAKP